MIIVKDLVKKYGDFTAVDNLNLQIYEGEFFGLLGPNGAGKTTTVKMMSTLSPITSGKITIGEQEINRDQTEIKKKIGIVPQQNNLEMEMTAWENLELHGSLYGMPKKERRKRIDELLEFTELTSRKNDLTRDFSGGMKRKLMIARGLMHNPDILILDEPTVGLDANARRKMWDLLKSLKVSGLTVLLTTHYIEEAEVLCDRVGLIDSGKLKTIGTPKELINEVGSFVVDRFDNKETISKFFKTREEAVDYIGTLSGTSTIRPSNLEDIFIKLTNKRMDG